MVKRKRKYRYGSPITAIPFEHVLSLSTLGDNTIVKSEIIPAQMATGFYAISADISVVLRDATPGEGPISFGLAHGDLSTSEIVEALQAEVFDPSDIIARERARRPVRLLGQFPVLSADEALNHGDKQRLPLRFKVHQNNQVTSWALNKSGGTLTTGAQIEMIGVLYGRWLA